MAGGKHTRFVLLTTPLLLFVSSAGATTAPSLSLRFSQTPIPVATFHHSQTDRADEPCASSRPPEALATPDPLLDHQDSPEKVAVSFVIGIDGRVHSPVILESAGSEEDLRVLQALRIWRYRPATCNAAPTEMESKVEFSTR